MRIYDLPVENNRTGNTTQYTINLDDVDYNFAIYYNRRIDTWFLSVSNADNSVVLEQMPLLLGVNPMINTFAYSELLPFGDVQVADDPEDNIDPTLDNLGDSKNLVYVSVIDA